VQTESGGQLRRNRQDILVTPKPTKELQAEEAQVIQESEPEETTTTTGKNSYFPIFINWENYGKFPSFGIKLGKYRHNIGKKLDQRPTA